LDLNFDLKTNIEKPVHQYPQLEFRVDQSYHGDSNAQNNQHISLVPLHHHCSSVATTQGVATPDLIAEAKAFMHPHGAAA
jgi:hypothetical protein